MAKKKPTASALPLPATYRASVFGSVEQFPVEFSSEIEAIENELGMPVWLMLQNDEESQWGEIGPLVWRAFFAHRQSMARGQKVALLIDSPGGYAKEAYRIATFLRQHCGGFVALVPSYAKSAATLLVLGADTIILGEHAELGPIDAQAHVPEVGRRRSVLDDVQTLERLNAFALKSLDETMQLLLRRTGMRVDALLPEAMEFVDNLIRPLMESIDATRWTEMSRVLKVGEEYAIRLLRKNYPGEGEAEKIARHLVERYPEHGFAITKNEAEEIGIEVVSPTGALAMSFENLMPFMDQLTAFGKLEAI